MSMTPKETAVHEADFPFEEIRRPDGDYWSNWKEAKEAGYDDDQIWSVTVHDECYCYGPPEHYVNHLGHVATKERHDGNTYYEEIL